MRVAEVRQEQIGFQGEGGRRKAHGIHYTPSDLARFVAARGLGALRFDRLLTVFDPACGDGELLVAVADEAQARNLAPPRLFGTDIDPAAVQEAQRRLRKVRASEVVIHQDDFIGGSQEILADVSVDLMISNPPYVRTQVLGTHKARELARKFDLRGRVDLYHAFVAAMTACLSDDSVLALLCSNRFLTTRGGASLRGLLGAKYAIREIWDLGDSKFFDAAVLPAIVIATRGSSTTVDEPIFARAYETDRGFAAAAHDSLLDALGGSVSGAIQVGEREMEITRGTLADLDPKRAWQPALPETSDWLSSVRKHSAGRLADIGPLRVGIKTTADKVFISDAWDDLPPAVHPEPEVMRPLLTHHVAARWTSTYPGSGGREVLYTHEATAGGRAPIDLARYPRAAAYLDQYREQLEGRKYVEKAGRRWYEIWVPQQPAKWAAAKLVWPDISEGPRFFLDETGAVVNGDCYWLSCGDASDEEIALALAVANSTFTVTFYDICCGNRLYSGRRRFITQYLEQLPLPLASTEARSEVADMVTCLRKADPTDAHALETALDDVIHRLFGLKEPSRQP
jgi:adenine-specific DNA-methyltransferase